MLVLSVERSAEIVESAIGDLGAIVGSHDTAEIKSKVYDAWKKLGEARVLLRSPDMRSSRSAKEVAHGQA
jgi:hypothetical protein